MIKRATFAVIVIGLALSCSPALNRQLTQEARVNVPFDSMQKHPRLYKADLYLLGGLILGLAETPDGTLIEALYIPVSKRGFIRKQKLAGYRYFALLSAGTDVDIRKLQKGMYMSIAAVFTGIETGTTNGVKKRHPLFTIKDIHLWGDSYREAFRPPLLEPSTPGTLRPFDTDPFRENPVFP